MLQINACRQKTLNLGTQGPEVTMRDLAQICIDIVGKDLIIKVPPGTEIYDENKKILLADLIENNQKIILAFGGSGDGYEPDKNETEEWTFTGLPPSTPAADYSNAITGDFYYNSSTGQFKNIGAGEAVFSTKYSSVDSTNIDINFNLRTKKFVDLFFRLRENISINIDKSNYDLIYSRFTFHSITNKQHQQLLNTIKEQIGVEYENFYLLFI